MTEFVQGCSDDDCDDGAEDTDTDQQRWCDGRRGLGADVRHLVKSCQLRQVSDVGFAVAM